MLRVRRVYHIMNNDPNVRRGIIVDSQVAMVGQTTEVINWLKSFRVVVLCVKSTVTICALSQTGANALRRSVCLVLSISATFNHTLNITWIDRAPEARCPSMLHKPRHL